MANISSLAFKLFGIFSSFTITIAAVYIWVLPMFFHGYKTYSCLVVGASIAALLGGFYCYKATNVLMSETVRYLLSSLCGVVVAALVALFSLLIIVNVRGT
jgi:hypothetical protein